MSKYFEVEVHQTRLGRIYVKADSEAEAEEIASDTDNMDEVFWFDEEDIYTECRNEVDDEELLEEFDEYGEGYVE